MVTEVRGRRGQKRKTLEELDARGSWLAAARRKEMAAEKAAKQRKPKRRRQLRLPESLEELILRVPGYDPRVGADEYVFDAGRAEGAIRWIFRHLTHVEGEWGASPEHGPEPLKLEPWQMAVMANLFGWYHRKTGVRRYREVFIYIPRKNGKTTLGAALVNYLAFCDGEPGGQLYSAAAARHQAAIIFRHAKGMIKQSDELAANSRIYQHSITYPNETFYKPLSRDAGTAHGLNPSVAIVDELHMQPDGQLVEALVTGTAARRQPLIVSLTTADYQRDSVCNAKYKRACDVRDGVAPNARFLPVIYEAGKDDDWTDEKVWAKANPNLGVSVSLDDMRSACQEAKQSPSLENAFKRFRLNIITEQDTRWLSMSRWDECGGGFDPRELRGRPCFVGVDLASTTDLTAAVLLFPEDGFKVVPLFWCPEDEIRERSRRDRVEYVDWKARGFIEATPGNVMDHDYVRERLNQLAEDYEIVKIGVDPWNGTKMMVDLESDGFDVVSFRQGYASLSGPSKELEKRVIGGKIRHGGNPVLRWMASNVTVEQDAAGNIKPSKKAGKATQRIDGIVALIMAVGLWQASQEPKASVYEDRGIRRL